MADDRFAGFLFRLVLGSGRHRIPVFRIKHWNPVAPPKLAAQAPFPYIPHPVDEDRVVSLREEFDFAHFDRFDNGRGKRRLIAKPLLTKKRLDDLAASLADGHVHLVIFDLDEKLFLYQVRDDALTRFEPVESCIGSAVSRHPGSLIEQNRHGQIVANADLVVVRIVGRRDLYRSGAERRVGIDVFD